MKIHKALKVKNRLAGEVARLMELLKRENSRRSDNTSTVNCADIYKQLTDNFEKLIAVKSAISVANREIYNKIVRLNELKGLINFVKSLPTRKGEEKVFTGRGDQVLTYTWDAYLTQEEVDKKAVAFQEQINQLQDEIDIANSNTEVGID